MLSAESGRLLNGIPTRIGALNALTKEPQATLLFVNWFVGRKSAALDFFCFAREADQFPHGFSVSETIMRKVSLRF